MLRGLLALIPTLLLGPTAVAVDFRIETKVYAGDEELPVTQNTTLFQNGVVYDFLEVSKRVAIFRHRQEGQPGQFLLIDPVRSVKTTVTTDRIDTAIDKLRSWSRTQRNPLLTFAADPSFDEKFDAESGSLTLESQQMTYRLATLAVEHSDVWRDLRNYFDGYAKLNCILSSSMPPTPRLVVNAALEKHNVVPVEVNLSLEGDENPQLRAEHLYTWRLSKDDRARIALVGEQLVSFREVSNAEFQEESVAAK